MMQAEISRVQTAGDRVPAKPALAANVQLLGEMPDNGFIDRQWLIERDGRFVQVTELLYRIAEQANGERTLEDIAASVTNSTKWIVDADDVRQLIRSKLLPLRLVGPTAEMSLPSQGVITQNEPRSPLQLNLRIKAIGPRLINPLTATLQYLYLPAVLIPVLIAAACAHGWMYGIHGISAGVREALYTPGALLLVVALMSLGGAFHEFGHASALRYGGGNVRGMGVGLYLIYPVLYTDVSDSYRLGRKARLRTDLGGVYFHLIFSLGLISLSAITGKEVLLFAAFIIDGDILAQFIPLARLDGYWVLADLTGIPDFFSQMGSFLRSLDPVKAFGGSRFPKLKPWVRVVFAFYTVVTMPVLAFLFVLMLIKLPGFLAKTWDSFLVQVKVFSGARAHWDFLLMTLSGVQMLFLALPAFGSMYVVYGVARIPARALWRWSNLTPTRRIAGALAAAVCIAVSAVIGMPKLGVGAGTQGPGRLAERLDRIREATANIQTLQADLEGSAGGASFTGTVLLKRPKLARINISGHEGLEDSLVASDGTDLWTYFPSANQFVRSIPGAKGRNIQALLVDQVILFFRPEAIGVAPKGSASTYAGREAVDGASYDVIEIATSGPPKRTVRYFVSPTDHIIHRIVIKEEQNGRTSVRWSNLKNVQTNLSIDESAFRWAPPATATPLQWPTGLLLPNRKEDR
jgi:putative peptide zinc metalloprotease protein